MTLAQAQAFELGTQAATGDDDRTLIERVRRNPEDFGLLYQRFAPLLLNHVYRRTGDTHATEDLVADTFLIVMRSLPGYRYRGIPLRAWLLRIATNTVNRWARRRRRWAFAALEADRVADDASRSTHGTATAEQLQHALLALPPRFQAVLSLHHMEGLCVKETAAIVGCREGTVRSRLARARSALRSQLNGRS